MNIPSTQPAFPLNVQSQSSLLEDIVGRAGLLLPDDSHQRIATYKNPFNDHKTEAIVIIDGTLKQVRRDSESSNGWRLVDIAGTDYRFDDVATATAPDGLVYACVTGRDGEGLLKLMQDGFVFLHSAAGPRQGASAAYTPLLPYRGPIFFSSTENGNLRTMEYAPGVPEPAPFQFLEYDLGGALASNQYILCPMSYAQYMLGVIQSGVLNSYAIDSIIGLVSSPSPLDGPVAMKDVVAGFVYGPDKAGFVCLGGDDHLYVFAWSIWMVIPGVSAKAAWATIDTDSLLHLYLLNADGQMSILHQTGWSLDQYPTWSTLAGGNGGVALPFATNVARITVDPTPSRQPTLIAYSDETAGLKAVRLMSQDMLSYEWSSQPINLPATQFYKTVRWHQQATLLDAAGSPLSNYEVMLHSDATTELEIAGQGHQLLPARRSTVTLRTDMFGRVAFATNASGLTTPSVTLSADGLMQEAELRPDRHVQLFLAGLGELPWMPEFNGPTLRAATTDGRPLIPPHIWDHITPDHAVKAIRNIIAIGDRNLNKPLIAGFVLQRIESDRPGYQEFSSSAELFAELERFRSSALYGGTWEWASSFAQDIWHGIKTGALRIAKVVADTVRKTVQLTADINNTLIHLGEIALDSMEDTFHAVGGLFSTLEANVEAVIDWLQQKLPIADIWDTKNAIENWLLRLPPFLEHNTYELKSWVRANVLGDMRAWNDEAFSALTRQFPNATLGDFNAQRHQPNVLLEAGEEIAHYAQIVFSKGDAAANWLWDKFVGQWLPDFSKFLPSILLPHFESLRPDLERLILAFETVAADLAASLSQFAIWLSEKLNLPGTHPNMAFAAIEFQEFVLALKNLSSDIISALDVVLDVVVDVVVGVVRLMGGMFTAEIKLGIIETVFNWLHQMTGNASGEKKALTLASFFSALIAFPTTMTYKMIYGRDAKLFPGGANFAASFITNSAASQKNAVLLVGVVSSLASTVFAAATDWQPTAGALAEGADLSEAEGSVAMGAGLTSIMLTCMTQLCSWPSTSAIPFSPIPWGEPKDIPPVLHWGTPLFLALVDALMLGLTKKTTRNTASGVIFDTAIGMMDLVFGTLKSILLKEKTGQYIANIGLPLLPATQFFRYPAFVAATDGSSLALKTVLDLLVGFPAALCKTAWMDDPKRQSQDRLEPALA